MKHRVWGQSNQERVLEDPELIGKAITICDAKEIGHMAGADGMQTAIRQYRQTEIILARLRRGTVGVQRGTASSPAPPAHTKDPLPHCSKWCESVRCTWKYLVRPARNSSMFRGIANAEHKYRAVATLASSGLLQRSSRDENEGLVRGESNMEGGAIY